MTDIPSSMPAIYSGWQNYQGLLTASLAGLTADQLALSAAPGLRSIGGTTTHMISARARWFHLLMGEGGDEFAALGTWDRQGQPARSAAELVRGLDATWNGMQAAIAGWTPADWAHIFPSGPPYEDVIYTRHWVIWHLIEHDLHHGGEISIILGMHGLKAPDL